MDRSNRRPSTSCFRGVLSSYWPCIITLCLFGLAVFVVSNFHKGPDTGKPDWSFTRNFKEQVGLLKSNENAELRMIYVDASGNLRVYKTKVKDLSPSWIPRDRSDVQNKPSAYHKSGEEVSLENAESKLDGSDQNTIFVEGYGNISLTNQTNPVKLERRYNRTLRKEKRTAFLTSLDDYTVHKMQISAIELAKKFNVTSQPRYGIWRPDYSNSSTTTLKLLRDQLIMAKVYLSIAQSKKHDPLRKALLTRIRDIRPLVREATSDAELKPSVSVALDQAKQMGRVLAWAKKDLEDYSLVARKLRAMLQIAEESVTAFKKESMFLTQVAAKLIPKPIHCLSLRLTTEYFLMFPTDQDSKAKDPRIDDPSLYHYALFSDNVLATSVVVNSTLTSAKQPEKHVFHIVTDKLNFAAMKMWFLTNPPGDASVYVENVDDFKWLNSSYCPVLRQLESEALKAYYFKAEHPTTIAAADTNLKYRNPKYLSMLNHLRFYLPQVYPKLEKVLFLDDDIVVQKDLTPLWDVDMKGMVNGAVETCKESFHRFDKYLNFSNPIISQNFDPNACGWAFGMNMFDLKEWRKRDMTSIYHRWQNLNENRTLWKLGSLPPGLITFYNLTYPMDKSWHVLGLGYDATVNETDIHDAGVIHYNGNLKPWLELAISKFIPFWTKYVPVDHPYLQQCNVV
ncbi:hypothetical protein AMTRI_Chr08g208320 [Amborella trichopoda]